MELVNVEDFMVYIVYGQGMIFIAHVSSTHSAAAASAAARTLAVEHYETITEIRVIGVKEMQEISI